VVRAVAAAEKSAVSVKRAVAEERRSPELEFYRGNRLALMRAVGEACEYGVPIPPGLMHELDAGLRRF
jgi:hypothetical protein